MDAQEKKLKMATSGADTLSPFEALQELGLQAFADRTSIHSAFRLHVRNAAPALHKGCEQRLRRLIAARDVLIEWRHRTQARPSFAAHPLPLALTSEQALTGGIASLRIPALEYGAENVTSLMQVIEVDTFTPPGLQHGDTVCLTTRTGDRVTCRISIVGDEDAQDVLDIFRRRWAR